MATYKLSPATEQDLIDIYIRGLNKWGVEQADNFQHRLISSFHILVNNPDLGRPVAIRPQLQRHDVDPYVIFYRKFTYGIRVTRILYKTVQWKNIYKSGLSIFKMVKTDLML